MGGDIAAWCAQRGLNVTLQDRELKFIEPALQRAREGFEKRLKDAGKAARAHDAPDARTSRAMACRAPTSIIEAIFENADAKHELFARVEPRMKPSAILASNTSSIMLEQLDDKLPDPGRLVGLHFFNPVAQMPLVEIVRGEASSDEAIQKAIAFTRKIDKLPLPCKSAPGFLVNRVLVPYLYEAMFALQDGIPIETIDEAALRYGMPMGPVELADVVGLDVCKHVGDIVSAALEQAEARHLAHRRADCREETRPQERRRFLRVARRQGGQIRRRRRAEPPADLEDRLILALANECAAVLREKIVADADLIDAGVIFGSGFAPFRGGPLTYARKRGVDAVVARLTELARSVRPALHARHRMVGTSRTVALSRLAWRASISRMCRCP